jgi:hypothetical protein
MCNPVDTAASTYAFVTASSGCEGVAKKVILLLPALIVPLPVTFKLIELTK